MAMAGACRDHCAVRFLRGLDAKSFASSRDPKILTIPGCSDDNRRHRGFVNDLCSRDDPLSGHSTMGVPTGTLTLDDLLTWNKPDRVRNGRLGWT